MEGLQRSSATFRRSGSSGLVWEEKFSEELVRQMESNVKAEAEGKPPEFPELRPPTGTLQPAPPEPPAKPLVRSNSRGKGDTGGAAAAAHQAAKEVPPAFDPPSPRVAACGFCGIFGGGGKPAAAPAARRQPPPQKQRPKQAARR